MGIIWSRFIKYFQEITTLKPVCNQTESISVRFQKLQSIGSRDAAAITHISKTAPPRTGKVVRWKFDVIKCGVVVVVYFAVDHTLNTGKHSTRRWEYECGVSNDKAVQYRIL